MRKTVAVLFGALVFLLSAADGAKAGEADVVDVAVRKQEDGRYHFDVTVRHVDSGWDHYADRWEVVWSAGAVLATRVLAHPHENEQPFTRSLGNVVIPKEADSVVVRAHDKVHGYGGREMTVAVPR